ncbi:hypothetical protein DSO57_1035490 [Entomophthora muscae]|uniref:Uncharacterized protein n=1 Tax=Entomophthora muscae TaxID=34485 RepID=A0ACC2TXE5_9FUNG|nr:hypothetical protein DSO57_1035490 [Entomophthora muscae]
MEWMTNQKEFVHLSDIPEAAKNEGCILGVDEAGRGPVLGPMVYAVCFYVPSIIKDFGALGFADSKTLTEDQRDGLFDVINQNKHGVAYGVHSLSPGYISACMLRRSKYNLNALAHDTTIGLIRTVLSQGVIIKEIYVDTVGPPEKYEIKLSQLFPHIKIKVSKKADSLYPCVSAASICAKVTRDSILKNWQFEEPGLEKAGISRVFGSGYPGDPNTISWLNNTIDRDFGWPSIIRFSWGTCDRLLEIKSTKVIWPEDEEAAKNTLKSKRHFLDMVAPKASPKPAPERTCYFTQRSMSKVLEL